MATIDINDAYILNETGAQVDKVTGLFYKDESTTAAEKAFAQLNVGASLDLGITGATIGQMPVVASVDGSGAPTSWSAATPSSGGGGGRNLLDNPWFTVNQRSATTISGSSAGVFSVDRWRLFGSTTSLTVTNDGVQVNSAANGLLQRFDDNIGAYLNGKTVTVSAMDKAGNIASKSLTYSNASMQNTGTLTLGSKTCTIYLGLISSYQAFSIATGSYTIDLRAVKLELGTTSTLAQDAPPDYAEELAKCKCYFERLKATGSYAVFGNGIAINTTNAYIFVPITPKRTATYTVSSSGSLQLYDTAGHAITGVTKDYSGAQSLLALYITSTGLTAAANYLFRASGDANAYIDLSADL